MKELIIKFQKIERDAIIPTKGSKLAAGLDFYCLRDIHLAPLSRQLIPTGIAWEPVWRDTETLVEYSSDEISNYVPYLQLSDRSGLANKMGVTVLGGIIDADYRGDIGFILYNSTHDWVPIPVWSRIGQGIVLMTPKYKTEEAKLIKQTKRGTGGFGSTGV